MATKKKTSGGSSTSAAAKKRAEAEAALAGQYRIRQEITAIALVALGVFLFFVSVLFAKSTGKLGQILGDGLAGIFGVMSVVLPFLLIGFGVILFIGFRPRSKYKMMILIGVMFLMCCALFAGKYIDAEGAVKIGSGFTRIYDSSVAGKCGGILGTYIAMGLVKLIGKIGLYIVAVAAIIVCGILAVNTPMSEYARKVGEKRQAARERRAESRAAVEAMEAAVSRESSSGQDAGRGDAGAADAPGASGGKTDDRPAGTGSSGRPRIIDMDTGETAVSTETGSPSAAAPQGFFPGFIAKFRGLGGKAADLPPVTYDEEDAPSTIENTLNAPGAENISEGQKKILETVLGDDIYGEGDGASSLGLGDKAEPPFAPLSFVKPEETFTLTDAFGPEAAADAALVMKPRKPKKKGLEGEKMRFVSASDDGYYEFPPISLLSKPARLKKTSEASLNENASKLEQALRDFRVEATVVNVTVGPTVTRYEVEPDVGVKIANIKSLEPDLARSLEVKSVRVVPMPGTPLIGIEAYNATTNTIALSDIIDSKEFKDNPSKIAVALGKNISGERIVTDLTKMPHLLIAGTTGSGKSVCINCLLISILYRAKPSEVKMLLIDPKQVELKMYEDIPHLLVPVVTNPERAAMALGYAVTIMDERYRKFSSAGVRNMESYNELMIKQGKDEEVMPQIVIVIDELSDLMAVASAKVQESISRLAAMARAAGMHLIVATQQPLASILTSVIKANIPSRIAFAVQSGSSSRVILDKPGAERLLGNGDLLFSPVGSREPMRIQGAFVSEKEVFKICDFIKKQLDPEYSDDMVREVVTGPAPSLAAEEDDLFRDAVDMVAQSKQASVSMIQRRFRIGYNRAARLVDMMEERGIVAPSDGTNKPRRLIMSEKEIESFLEGGALPGGAAPASPGGDFAEGSFSEALPADSLAPGFPDTSPEETPPTAFPTAPAEGAPEIEYSYGGYPDTAASDFDYSDFEEPGEEEGYE